MDTLLPSIPRGGGPRRTPVPVWYLFGVRNAPHDFLNTLSPPPQPGSAGLRLHFPALSAPGGHPPREERQPDEHPQPSAEVRIGQKLQMIGDQFHQDQLQLVRSKTPECQGRA